MRRSPQIICLSNVHDQHYTELREEAIAPCLSSPKRRDLFKCLEMASGREVTVLSVPPRAISRRSGRWLPAAATMFSTHQQFFCANWDAPKLRIVFSWWFYARHVLGHTRSGDVVVLDNYEFVYVVAAYLVKVFRRVTFVLEYEDGKHLIERSYFKLLALVAEWAGRPLIQAALLTHPELGKRLPAEIPKELVPGLIVSQKGVVDRPFEGELRFLYAGSLDRTRGVDLLLAVLHYLPSDGWHLDVTGDGPLASEIVDVANSATWSDKVTFHGNLPASAYQTLVERCHVGLNCQRSSDRISSVTFPSKIFSYLSAGLLVLSSKASEVEQICQRACIYFDGETPMALGAAMTRLIKGYPEICQQVDRTAVNQAYSAEGTVERLKILFKICLPK